MRRITVARWRSDRKLGSYGFLFFLGSVYDNIHSASRRLASGIQGLPG